VLLEDSALRPDDRRANEKYSKKVAAKSIVLVNALQIPIVTEKLISTLNNFG
jgi:hypothetical protein